MSFISEKIETPVAHKCDVLVVGGGFAGIAAALSAARAGAKTILVEKSYYLGGLGTSGLVTIYLPLCDGMGRLVKEHCDFVLSLPMKGRLNSLNASAAAAVTMYEVLRQRSK